jgi:hypothetical protein
MSYRRKGVKMREGTLARNIAHIKYLRIFPGGQSNYATILGGGSLFNPTHFSKIVISQQLHNK